MPTPACCNLLSFHLRSLPFELSVVFTDIDQSMEEVANVLSVWTRVRHGFGIFRVSGLSQILDVV
jgi:hypothetical protein